MSERIIAAGGLVLNDKNELLMIFRRGKWDLPKGKLDKGETIEECALREVKEETGLKNVKLDGFIGITRHEYYNEHTNSDALKETHWFKMIADAHQTLTPQTEEGIEQIEWADEEAINDKLNNSFPNIAQIISKL